MNEEFVKKIVALNTRMGVIKKDGYNKSQNYNYISADQIANALRKGCIELGLVATFDDELVHRELYEQNGKTKFRAVICSKLFIADGTDDKCPNVEYIAYNQVHSTGYGEGVDGGDKATMKAVTAARKYAIMGMFQLAEGMDPEAFKDTDEDAKATKKPEETKLVKAKRLLTSAQTKNDFTNAKAFISTFFGGLPADDQETLKGVRDDAAKRLGIN